MPDIGEFIPRSRRSAKITIAAPDRAHLAIFADRGDRPIKSPSVSLALSSLLWFQSNVFVDQCVIVDQLLPSLQTPENAIRGPLAIYLSSSDLIPTEL